MKKKKSDFRRYAACLTAVLLLVTALCGCSDPSQNGDPNSVLKLPNQVSTLAEAPAIAGSQVALDRQDSEPLSQFSEALIRAAWSEDRAENAVLSPVSVYLAMMVTACSNESMDPGAMAEWETLFGVSQEQWDLWGTKLMRHLNWSKEDSCVAAANSVWLDTDMVLTDSALQRISQHLYTDVYQGDLQSDEIVKAVNAWVNHKTQGMIPQLRQDPYEDMTEISVLNSVYLEAKWQQGFLASRTQEEVFYTADGKEVTTEFLQDYLCRRAYVQTEDWDGVMLPYRDGNLAFVALRPSAGQSVDDLLLSLEAEDWTTCCEDAVDTLMNFSMPKFTVEHRQLLTDALAQMGMDAVLEENQIGIGQAVKIQVDEDGTKAAAVTEVTAAGAIDSPEEPPLEIHFDQPFVYAVVDTVTQIPLFVGVMDCPVQE